MTWTQSNKTGGSFMSVYYGNGIWVACGPTLYYSTDGKTWTQSNVPGDSFYCVYYANGIWVAGSYSIGLWYSTDGMTWTQSSVTSGTFYSVYYGNGIWVAGRSGSSAGLYYMSVGEMTFNTENKNWEMSNSTVATLTNADNTVPTLGALAYVRLTNEPNIWYLATAITAGSSSPYSKTLAYKIKYTAALDTTDVKFIADDDSMKYPDGGWLDGLYYTTFSTTLNMSDWIQSNITDKDFNHINYANGLWVAASGDGQGVDRDGLFYSRDGKTWNQSNITDIGFLFTYYANNMWIAASNNGNGMYYSEDGITWSRCTPQAFNFYEIHYANGIWVSCANNGIYHSTDGKTWTRDLDVGGFYTLNYANNLWVAGGWINIGIYYSTDGITWIKSNASISNADYKHIYYANNIWIAATTNYNKGIYYSTDGKTWLQSNITKNNFFRVDYYDGVYVIAGGLGLLYSTDGKTWNQSNITSDNGWFTYIHCHNGLWIACSTNNGLYYSKDGMSWIQSNITSGKFTYAYYDNDTWIACGIGIGIYYSEIASKTYSITI